MSKKEDIIARLLRDRLIFLGTPIDDEVATDVIAKMLFLQMQHATRPALLYINSPGGSVTATLAIYDTIQSLTCPVSTYNIGLAHSAACLLLCAGAQGSRYMIPQAEVAFSRITEGVRPAGQSAEEWAANMQKLSERWTSIYLKHTNLTHGEIEHFSANNTSLTAEHALAAGIVDEVVQPTSKI